MRKEQVWIRGTFQTWCYSWQKERKVLNKFKNGATHLEMFRRCGKVTWMMDNEGREGSCL